MRLMEMKKICLVDGQFSSRDALEILTAYIHVEVSLYQRKMELEDDLDKKAEYSASIHRLQKILFEACEFIERKNGAIHLSSKLDIS
jgi:hypothetical protein